MKGKKKKSYVKTRTIRFRVTDDFGDHIDKSAATLGTNVSHLCYDIVKEKLNYKEKPVI